MVNFEYKEHYTVEDLDRIIHILRAPGGCPWDIEQTHASIRRNMLEEAYEAVEAIDEADSAHLCEELGDVMEQVVFHAAIEEEAGRFTLDDVADGICKKLIFRHPHVFGDGTAATSAEVLTNWDALKRVEKGQTTHTAALESVARSLPALWRAEKVQAKARKAGFDWPDMSGALDKIAEETAEFKAAVDQGTNVEEEFGDLLFAAVNAARFLHIDPEAALSKACDKFIRRFAQVEAMATADGAAMETLPLAELDKLWDKAKEQEKHD